MKNYYTGEQYKKLLSDIVIICTTNEQKNDHITKFFDKHGVKYVDKSLETGDYCFKLKSNAEHGRLVDQYFTDELFIERKNSLSELASSIKDNAFHNELKRAKLKKHKYLLVEQQNGWQGVLIGDYRNQYDRKAFYATLHTLMVKYDLRIIFTDKEDIGRQIYAICKSVLDNEILK